MNKVAIVTGASRGIGRAVAVRLARGGYAVAACYHTSREAADELVQQLREEGCHIASFFCDVGNADSVKTMIKNVTNYFGEVSVLVNNAGFAQQKLFTDITDADWERMMQVHLNGTFYACREVLPSMINRKCGCIVNVSSMWGQVGGSCEVHYSAAKAGVIGLTKALAKEIGPSNIRVNCVAPGVIQTDMMASFDEDAVSTLIDETPLMRLGTPEDVASVVNYLVSDEAAFITGQVIAPNGGMVI